MPIVIPAPEQRLPVNLVREQIILLLLIAIQRVHTHYMEFLQHMHAIYNVLRDNLRMMFTEHATGRVQILLFQIIKQDLALILVLMECLVEKENALCAILIAKSAPFQLPTACSTQ